MATPSAIIMPSVDPSHTPQNVCAGVSPSAESPTESSMPAIAGPAAPNVLRTAAGSAAIVIVMICVLSPSSARKNATATVRIGPKRPAVRSVSSSSTSSPRSVHTPKPMKSRPVAMESHSLGMKSPTICPTSVESRWITSVATKMPVSTCHAL